MLKESHFKLFLPNAHVTFSGVRAEGSAPAWMKSARNEFQLNWKGIIMDERDHDDDASGGEGLGYET